MAVILYLYKIGTSKSTDFLVTRYLRQGIVHCRSVCFVGIGDSHGGELVCVAKH
jgi:hypothetical protein